MESAPHNPVASIGQLFLDFMATRHDLEQAQRALQIAEARVAGLEGELLGARAQLEGMASELKRLTVQQEQSTVMTVDTADVNGGGETPGRDIWLPDDRVISRGRPLHEAAD